MRTKTTLAVRLVTRVSRVDSSKTLPVSTGCFYLVHIFASTKYLSVIYGGRGLGSANLVVYKYSITDHSNQLL